MEMGPTCGPYVYSFGVVLYQTVTGNPGLRLAGPDTQLPRRLARVG